jgi:flagellar biosynthesis/type III secretory pathway protein FliH
VSPIVKRAGETSPLAAARIVPRPLVSASDEARRLLEAARQEAATIVASAEGERAAAVEAGYRQGYERGAQEWASALRAARDRVEAAIAEARPQIVRLALRVAEKILRQKVEASPEAIEPMIDEALRSFQGQSPMRLILRVNPADQAALEARRQRWLDRQPLITSLSVVPDEAVSRGGCRLESDFGTVDATLETQLQAIERHLLGEGGDLP